MKLVGKSVIGRKRAKEGFEYPIVRFPKEFKDLIGKEVRIYQINENNFLISIDEIDHELYNKLYNLFDLSKINKNLLQKAKELGIDISSVLKEKLKEILSLCGGRDLNPRTPTGQGLKPCAFSWLGNPRGNL